MAPTSNEGEKTCPLCMEEMDLTDQQLKPCKCGYEICVWCWHHVMDMAEKDDTEGRCPACRTPYDKEKIVGMAANCERMVVEINSERRLKSQKAKSKTSEGRKHLSSVRVIQRNLVYVLGLPANLADEAILEQKEYFGQYGKVLKVSVTRPASGNQHPSNTSTCNVYITYTKEEEAVRCIQSVHGFVLEGRSLRVCFGTTKYCHTWLRNMPCNNPDCLYLHDLGTPEDSFTKDETISAYTRSRVQQITGAANNAQRCSGNVLPPPADDFCNNSSTATATGKVLIKSAPNNPSSQVKVSTNGSISGRSGVLPAAASWGMRASSNYRQPGDGTECSQGSAKQKTDTLNGSSALSSITASAAVTSDLCTYGGKTPMPKEKDPTQLNGSAKHSMCQTIADAPLKIFSDSDPANLDDKSSSLPEDKNRGITKPSDLSHSEELGRQQSCNHGEAACGCGDFDESTQSLSSRLSSIDFDNHLSSVHSEINTHQSPCSCELSTGLDGNPVVLQQCLEYESDTSQPLTSLQLRRSIKVSEGSCVPRELPSWNSGLKTQVSSAAGNEIYDAQLPVDGPRLELSETVSCPSYLPYPCNPLKTPHLSSGYSSHQSEAVNTGSLGIEDQRAFVKGVDALFPFGDSALSNGYGEKKFCSSELGHHLESSNMFPNVGRAKHSERFSRVASEVDRIADVDLGESSIISDIFSSDFVAWDDLAKLLGETDKQNGNSSSSWKPQNCSQSRFSFARQDDLVNRATHLEPSFSDIGRVQKYSNLHDCVEDRGTSHSKFQNGLAVDSFEASGNLINGLIPSSRVAVSRAQISAPPGFSVPSRLPPPGFTSQERIDRAVFSASSGNQLLESPLLRKQFQMRPTENIGDNFGDLEFIDPAILAVGKGTLPLATSNCGMDLASTFSTQLNVSEQDSRLPLLMQQSFSAHQNFRISSHMDDRFQPLSDSYFSSSLLEHTEGDSLSQLAQMSLEQSRNSQMSDGLWDGWNGVRTGNDMSLPEIVRNERLGFTKYFSGHDDLKFHMPTSADLYNRAFGF